MLAVSVVLAVIALILMAVLALMAVQQRRELGEQADRYERLLGAERTRADELQNQLLHFVTTARDNGLMLQPMDEAFGTYRITPEMEADLEGRD